jgi:4-carboxymuconolactone decarboxylase
MDDFTVERLIPSGAELLPDDIREVWDDFVARVVSAGVWGRPNLSTHHRCLVSVAALATLGCSAQLRLHLQVALRTGISSRTLGGVLSQVGGYAGMGRGFEAMLILGEALAETGQQVPDVADDRAALESWPDTDPLSRGLAVLKCLIPDKDPLQRQYDFLPDWFPWLVETAFGDLWARGDLTLVERERVTMAVLVALGREDELRSHFKIAMQLGITPPEIGEELLHLAVYVGFPSVVGALRLADEVVHSSASA